MISIVIVNWNGIDVIRQCLDGLRAQTRRDFSVIMVDNASQDGSLEFVQENFLEVKILVQPENIGFSAANNVALKSVRTEYVALLNNDAVPHRDWLKNLVDALERDPQAGFCASKMLFYDYPGIIDRAGDVYTTAATSLLRGRGAPDGEFNVRERVFGACAGAALYRTRMFDEIGLFDEDFFLVYEDVDLSFRAQLRGYKCLYVPEAIVYHHAGRSIGDDSPISVYYSHRNLEWVYIQNMPSGLIAKTILPHLIYVFAAFFFFVLKGRGLDFIKAKWHALKGMRRAHAKRKRIQKSRTVSDDYIWSLFEKERLLPRLSRRISKSPESGFKTTP